MNKALIYVAIALSFISIVSHAQPHSRAASIAPELLYFSPRGEIAKVRQVVARFSKPITAFGNPRAQDPFSIDCLEKGQGRWVDPTTWVYDFEQDLPAGIACAFKLQTGLKSLAGEPVLAEEQYRFTTGGPKIVFSRPYQEERSLREKQVWLLGVNATADRTSVIENARCLVANETRKIVVLGEEERDKLVEQHGYKSNRPPGVSEMLALKCEGELPTAAAVGLVWGKDIRSASGVSSEKDQTFNFTVRGPLAFDYRCGWGKNIECPFDQPISVNFTAPVLRSKLEAITLTLSDGKIVKPIPIGIEGDFLQGISFPSPLPPLSTVTLRIPAGIRDDSGRLLDEGKSQTREISIGDVPSLIQFATPPYDVGVLESKLGGIAPITLQNVEPELPLKVMKLPDNDREIVEWLARFGRGYYSGVTRESLLNSASDLVENRILLKQHDERAREVFGIELGRPGLYLLEVSSTRVPGAKPTEKRHIASAALVTNLALHFRRSEENALVWVTSLDEGKPVAGADIRISACDGGQVWQGITDSDGLSRIPADKLPLNRHCSGRSSSYLITARLADDFGMTFSDWRSTAGYGLSGYVPTEPSLMVHTVFDRSLFRAGETVSMKHILRQPTGLGFAVVDQPVKVSVQHVASQRSFELSPENLPGTGTANSQWKIPADAPLGSYRVIVNLTSGRYYTPYAHESAEFRVEEFRLPTMKAEVLPPREAQIAPRTVPVDLKLSYLGGGGVHQRVNIKAALRTASILFPGYDDYSFDMFGGGAERTDARHFARLTLSRVIAENIEVALDADGQGRAVIDKIPAIDQPTDLVSEMEFADANGEIQTASASVRLWPTAVLLGIKAANWVSARTPMPLQIVALGPDGKACCNGRRYADEDNLQAGSHR